MSPASPGWAVSPNDFRGLWWWEGNHQQSAVCRWPRATIASQSARLDRDPDLLRNPDRLGVVEEHVPAAETNQRLDDQPDVAVGNFGVGTGVGGAAGFFGGGVGPGADTVPRVRAFLILSAPKPSTKTVAKAALTFIVSNFSRAPASKPRMGTERPRRSLLPSINLRAPTSPVRFDSIG